MSDQKEKLLKTRLVSTYLTVVNLGLHIQGLLEGDVPSWGRTLLVMTGRMRLGLAAHTLDRWKQEPEKENREEV